MRKTDFENLHVYRLAKDLSDKIWNLVTHWGNLPQETIGKQLIRAADSIGPNIAEGTGRGIFQDNRRFVRVARASLHETKHWLRRAYKHELLTRDAINKVKPILDELSPRLNAYLKSIGQTRTAQKASAKIKLTTPVQTTDHEPLTTDN